jgi:pimeloyl-ACP methyl ester carboxylesterase
MTPTDVFREATVVAGGVRFHYATAGRGPLLLLLHGFPERWFSWRAQIPALAAEGYRVVAPDLRGYGLSDKPASGYEITDLAQDVASLIAALGEESATVIGHDWGGAITWEQFVRSGYMLLFNLPWLPERLIARDRGRSILQMFQGNSVHYEAISPQTLEALRESVASPDDVRPMLEYYRRSVRRALRGALPPYPVIQQPALLLWGEHDVVLGNQLIAPHTRVARDLTIRRIADCGHFVQQERPDEVNALLSQWLRATRPRATPAPA